MRAPVWRSRSFVGPLLVFSSSYRHPCRPVSLDDIHQNGLQDAAFFRRQIGFLVLGEDIEQKNRDLRPSEECDDPIAATLALALSAEPYLSGAARSFDHIAGRRAGSNPRYDGKAPRSRQPQRPRIAKECWCPYDGLHISVYSIGV